MGLLTGGRCVVCPPVDDACLVFKKTKLKKIADLGHVHIIRADKNIANGSFLNYIFLDEDALNADEMQQVVAHEMLHVKLFHSVDRIIAKIAEIVLWFNPFVYLYLKAIEENHEFEVDREIALETDKGQYASLLLHLSVAGQGTLYHNFSKVPLKKRITMLFNQPSANMKKIIYLLIVPVLLLSCLAFAKLKTDRKRSSAIGDISYLGLHPLVIIDGVEYPDDLLYKIGGKCIDGVGIWGAPVTVGKFRKYGIKVKDGAVEIKTKKHKITFLTASEKENMETEAAVPPDRFYSRIKLNEEDGSVYEKIIIKMPIYGDLINEPYAGSTDEARLRNGMSSILKPGEKAAFIINGKVYKEYNATFVENFIKSHKIGEYGTESAEAGKNLTKDDLSGYQSVFYFKADTLIGKTKSGQAKPELKNAPAAGQKKEADIETKVPDNQFYTRLKQKDKHGKVYDKVIFKLPTGGYVSDDLAPGEKAALVCEEKVYTETQVKQLEQIVKKQKLTVFGGGLISSYKDIKYLTKEDLSSYKHLFFFCSDTSVYGKMMMSNFKTHQPFGKIAANGKPIAPKSVKRYPLSPKQIALIKKLPGVAVDNEGNINANGQAVPKIRVNGQTIYSNSANTGVVGTPIVKVNGIKVDSLTKLAMNVGNIVKIKVNGDSLNFVDANDLQLYNPKGYRVYRRRQIDSLNAPNYIKVDALGNMTINGQKVTKIRVNGNDYEYKPDSARIVKKH